MLLFHTSLFIIWCYWSNFLPVCFYNKVSTWPANWKMEHFALGSVKLLHKKKKKKFCTYLWIVWFERLRFQGFYLKLLFVAKFPFLVYVNIWFFLLLMKFTGNKFHWNWIPFNFLKLSLLFWNCLYLVEVNRVDSG